MFSLREGVWGSRGRALPPGAGAPLRNDLNSWRSLEALDPIFVVVQRPTQRANDIGEGGHERGGGKQWETNSSAAAGTTRPRSTPRKRAITAGARREGIGMTLEAQL